MWSVAGLNSNNSGFRFSWMGWKYGSKISISQLVVQRALREYKHPSAYLHSDKENRKENKSMDLLEPNPTNESDLLLYQDVPPFKDKKK